MPKLFFFLLFACFSSFVSAQAFEDKIEYDKKQQPALAMEYKFPPEAVENAFISKLQKMGYKGKVEKGIFNRDKGFHVFKGALIGEISNIRYDFYVNIDQRSSKKDDESILYMIIMKDNENVLTKLDKDELRKAKSFLADLLPGIEEADLDIKIIAMMALLTKSDNKFKSLQGNRDDINSKIKKLQDDLITNEKDQERQQEETDKLRKALEELKSKKKSN
jgi:hypothetical protein